MSTHFQHAILTDREHILGRDNMLCKLVKNLRQSPLFTGIVAWSHSALKVQVKDKMCSSDHGKGPARCTTTRNQVHKTLCLLQFQKDNFYLEKSCYHKLKQIASFKTPILNSLIMLVSVQFKKWSV